ncbi:major facilitator superfamily domain-containing protein [Hyaloraphidium curvatum]|nr:major facilitator superfamily domain-containing protein [Hyaloraphidium curvatum]
MIAHASSSLCTMFEKRAHTGRLARHGVWLCLTRAGRGPTLSRPPREMSSKPDEDDRSSTTGTAAETNDVPAKAADVEAAPPTAPVEQEFILYPVRWFVMGAMMVLGTSFVGVCSVGESAQLILGAIRWGRRRQPRCPPSRRDSSPRRRRQSLNWNTFSPVSNRAAEYYGTTVSVINWFGLIIYVTSVTTGLFSAYLIDTRGMRVSLICAGALNMTGSWIRYLGTFAPDRHTALILGLLGQTVLGCGRPFAMNSTTRLASTFFGMKERTLANTLASVSPSFGVLLSSAVTSYIISTPDHVPLALLCWACYSVVGMITVLFVPEKPPTPPSPSASVMGATRTASLEKWKKSIKTAFTNWDYILLWTIMSGNLSLFFIYIVLISSIMLPYGYTAQQVGFVTVAIIATGWLALPISKVIDRTGGWVPALRSLLGICTVALVGLTLSLRPDVYWAIILCACVFGYANFPLLGIVFELAIEATYPDLLPAMSSCGLMALPWSLMRNADFLPASADLIFALAQIIAIILTPFLSGVDNKTAILWVLVGVSALGFLESLIYRGKAKRVGYETTVLSAREVAGAVAAAVEAVPEEGEGGTVELGGLDGKGQKGAAGVVGNGLVNPSALGEEEVGVGGGKSQ